MREIICITIALYIVEAAVAVMNMQLIRLYDESPRKKYLSLFAPRTASHGYVLGGEKQ